MFNQTIGCIEESNILLGFPRKKKHGLCWVQLRFMDMAEDRMKKATFTYLPQNMFGSCESKQPPNLKYISHTPNLQQWRFAKVQ